MDQLPPETLTKIVEYLIGDISDARKSVQDLFNFFATCQRFNSLNPQSIMRSLAIEFHSHFKYSNDRNINWRVILNAISSAYNYNSFQTNDVVDLAKDLVDHGVRFPNYHITKYIISMPIEDQRTQIREYLKKIPNINMIYQHSQTLKGTILFHLCHSDIETNDTAIWQYRNTLFEELLAAGADPNIPAIEGDYKPIYELIHYRIAWPILSASYYGWYHAVDRLLKVDGIALDVVGKADSLTHQTAGQIMPIHAACIYESNNGDDDAIRVIKGLLERVGSCSQMYAFSVSPNFCFRYYTNPLAFKKDQNNVTALHLACLRRSINGFKKAFRVDLDHIRLLFEYGANVDAQTTPDNFTPLHVLLAAVDDELTEKQMANQKMTVGFDLPSVVKFLVQEKKANLLLMNSSNRTVIDCARMVHNLLDASQSFMDLLTF